jgi:protein TonB
MPAPNDEPTFRGIDEALAPDLNAISEQLSGSGLAGITVAHVDGPELASPSMAEPPAPITEVVEPPPPPAVRIGGRVEPARVLKQSKPPYPHLAKQSRVQGVVIVEVTVGEAGQIEDVAVIEGHPLLIDAAVESVRHWKYQPATLNGAPIQSKFRIRFNFKLNFS